MSKQVPFVVEDDQSISNQKIKKKKSLNSSEDSNASCCRICWGTENEEADTSNAPDDGVPEFNPLISPCKCGGSVKMIHLKCLKEWLETKRSMKVHRS